MLTKEEKDLRYQELSKYADKAFTDFLTDWEYLCENASPKTAEFMKKAQDNAVKEILKMKDVVRINNKPLSYYLEDCECTFYEDGKFYSSMFYCIWHVANSCVYKRAHGNLSDGFHCQYKIDNSQFFPYISMAMLLSLLWHVLSGFPAKVDITFEHLVSGTGIMDIIPQLLSDPEFKDVSHLNYFFSIPIKHN